jgi:hypothetical protein
VELAPGHEPHAAQGASLAALLDPAQLEGHPGIGVAPLGVPRSARSTIHAG